MAKAAYVQVRRVYGPPKSDDGRRVLVDRLWPRGLSKERLASTTGQGDRALHRAASVVWP
jgi:uncharacterized protein YeaO (DUF488 family)